jgi:hypothetical protein
MCYRHMQVQQLQLSGDCCLTISDSVCKFNLWARQFGYSKQGFKTDRSEFPIIGKLLHVNAVTLLTVIACQVLGCVWYLTGILSDARSQR